MKRLTQFLNCFVLFSMLLLNSNCKIQNNGSDKLQNTINKMEPDKKGLTGMDTAIDGIRVYVNCPEKITVLKGASFQLKLNASAGTGYVWTLAKPSKLLALKNETELRYEKTKEDGNAQTGEQQVGGKTLQILEFTAMEAGTEKIELQYKRAWETSQSPADVCVFEVVVSQ